MKNYTSIRCKLYSVSYCTCPLDAIIVVIVVIIVVIFSLVVVVVVVVAVVVCAVAYLCWDARGTQRISVMHSLLK